MSLEGIKNDLINHLNLMDSQERMTQLSSH